ncbi:MAG: preprotein translocase subunit SecG [Bacteroidales bacterium]|nr:preprotein translocase subunit SecG [Bacteroidales bacterium]
MHSLLVGLIIAVSLLLILVVLVQNPKGGGLSSTFAGANQVMGVRKTADFFEKASWTLAIVLVVLSFLTVAVAPSTEPATQRSLIESRMQEVPSSTPDFSNLPTEQPSEQLTDSVGR